MKLYIMRIILILVIITSSSIIFAADDENCDWDNKANTTENNNQYEPSVTVVQGSGTYAGYFIIVWTGNNQFNSGGSGWDIYAQRYDNGGTEIGVETLININTSGDQIHPSVAMNNSGNMVITWQSGNDKIVYRTWSIFPASASLGTSEIVVKNQDGVRNPEAGIDDSGRVGITWFHTTNENSNGDVFARGYNYTGTPMLYDLTVSADSDDIELYPTIDMNGSGDFVIAWQKQDDDPDNKKDFGIHARKYYWSGGSLTNYTEIVVNTISSDQQNYPSVSIDQVGNFVIAWQSYMDTTSWDIYARRYYSNSTPIDTPEFVVNNYSTSQQKLPSVDMDLDGDFLIAWQNNGTSNNSWDIHAVEYWWDTSNKPPEIKKSEFKVNSCTYNDQIEPSVAVYNLDTDDSFYGIAWQGNTNDPPWSMDIFFKSFEDQNEDAITLDYFSATQERKHVVLNWQTGTEIDNLGFYLVRSENIGSDYLQVNDEIIPTNGGNNVNGSFYSYNDYNVRPGKLYFYWLISVDIYGDCNVYGPVKIITYLDMK